MNGVTHVSAPPNASPVNWRNLVRWIAAPLALTAAAMALVTSISSVGLGMFLGGFVIAAAWLPILCAGLPAGWSRRFVFASIIDAIAIVWLIAMLISPVYPETVGGDRLSTSSLLWQWARLYLLLAAFCSALYGLVLLLQRSKLPPAVVSLLVCSAALLWLSMPVWMSPTLEQSDQPGVIDALVRAHPLLNVNGVVRHQGIWTEHGLLYEWTALGQHVRYALPQSILFCVVVHFAIAVAGLFADWALSRYNSNDDSARERR